MSTNGHPVRKKTYTLSGGFGAMLGVLMLSVLSAAAIGVIVAIMVKAFTAACGALNCTG